MSSLFMHVCLVLIFVYLLIFLLMWIIILLGQDSGCVCKDDGARFQKASSTSVLSILACLHKAPEVEFISQTLTSVFLFMFAFWVCMS